MLKIKKLITSFFYIGYLPLMPGTFGSLAGLIIYIILRKNFTFLLCAELIIIILGFIFAGRAAKLINNPDPPQIVIDEVAGILISFTGLPLAGISNRLIYRLILPLGFIIFRIIDIVKLPPINRLHRGEGSLAIMGDDIIAGFYTHLALRFILFFMLK